MEKKYIVELGDENVRSADGYDWLQLLISIADKAVMVETPIQLLPYAEKAGQPDLEQVRKEAYDKGYEDANEEIGSDEQVIADKAYKHGLSDAWKCVDRIFDMPCKRREQIFSECDSVGVWDILREYSASEAIEKLKEDVHLGDEVTFLPNNAKGIVTECHVPDVYSDNDKYAVWCGGTMEYVLKQHLTKTGRTFPEIVEVLRKMREE